MHYKFQAVVPALDIGHIKPPFMLAVSVFAIAQARGDGQPVQLEAPATPEHVLGALGRVVMPAAQK